MISRAEMIAKLRLISNNSPEGPMFPEDDLRAIADALEQETRELMRVRDSLAGGIGAIEAGAVAERGGPSVNWAAVDATQDEMREMRDALTKVIGK